VFKGRLRGVYGRCKGVLTKLGGCAVKSAKEQAAVMLENRGEVLGGIRTGEPDRAVLGIAACSQGRAPGLGGTDPRSLSISAR
jgi:hypothetical protein